MCCSDGECWGYSSGAEEQSKGEMTQLAAKSEAILVGCWGFLWSMGDDEGWLTVEPEVCSGWVLTSAKGGLGSEVRMARAVKGR